MRCLFILLLWLVFQGSMVAAPPEFSSVVPGRVLQFPQDFGAHPDFRIEWWYVTGWLETEEGHPLGFQVTFFRTATYADTDNPSRFSPRQLIVAHVALSDPAAGKLLHDQKIRREGFDLVYARTGDTDIRLDDWVFMRETGGSYRAQIEARDLRLQLTLAPTQPLMLQGDQGYSRRGPEPGQASYYYSAPHLSVTGTIHRNGKAENVTGTAWLDHEWSHELIGPGAVGWDWAGANLDDGSALVVFQIRNRTGGVFWAYAALRDASGRMSVYAPEEIRFYPERRWRSARTQATYPVATRIRTGAIEWQLIPLMDDQELDARASIGEVYWEGAVTIARDGEAIGRGYLEMTGYLQPISR
ncbi:lipocalin-like domain-containing protein [Nitrosomonas sp. ANs5]|uniref:lipocalin-like domain-containing protein n=1 Tax=Nitrosomonas sp. ANs5 TaxID=3423941 RepID=UPI003D33687C